MLACAPESGSRTPTFSGPLCARATLSGALAANNPVAAAPTVKLRRVMEFVGDARVMCGSPWMCLLAVACRFLLSSSLQDAMGHDSALGKKGRARAGVRTRATFGYGRAFQGRRHRGRRRFRRGAALP